MDEDEEDEYEEDEVDDIIPPHRPGCLPRCDSSEVAMVSQKEKKVRFDPRVIMMDSCVRGDEKEFTEWMDELNIREIKDVQNRSLLHIALMHGHEHLVDDLIHKVDINQPDHDGKSNITPQPFIHSYPRLDLSSLCFGSRPLEIP